MTSSKAVQLLRTPGQPMAIASMPWLPDFSTSARSKGRASFDTCTARVAEYLMGFSASDFQVGADRLLQEFGYAVEGDDESGWSWRFGPSDRTGAAAMRQLPLDTAAEATAGALADMVACVHDVLAAGRAVLDRWERGDLADAVRELDSALQCLDPERAAGRDVEGEHRRAFRLLALARAGLTLDDCLRVFGQRSEAEPRLRARLLRPAAEGDIVAGEFTVVSEAVAGDGETHALAWVRIAPTL